MLTTLRVLACILLAVGVYFAFGVTVISVKEGSTFSTWFDGMKDIALPVWGGGGLLLCFTLFLKRSTNGHAS